MGDVEPVGDAWLAVLVELRQPAAVTVVTAERCQMALVLLGQRQAGLAVAH